MIPRMPQILGIDGARRHFGVRTRVWHDIGMPSPVADTSTAEDETPRRWSPKRLLLWAVISFLAALFVLAIPLLFVQHYADAARDELNSATDSLSSGDVAGATDHVHSARHDVTMARWLTDGPRGWLWGVM